MTLTRAGVDVWTNGSCSTQSSAKFNVPRIEEAYRLVMGLSQRHVAGKDLQGDVGRVMSARYTKGQRALRVRRGAPTTRCVTASSRPATLGRMPRSRRTAAVMSA